MKHNVRYELAVNEGNPRLKAGANVRAWLPFPQEYRQQRDVKLIGSEPAEGKLSDNGSPHRTIYFEETVNDLSSRRVFAPSLSSSPARTARSSTRRR